MDKYGHKKHKKIPVSRFVCRSPMKVKYMLLQNEKLEEYMKGEPIKTKRPKIKKQKRSSSCQRKKKKKKKKKEKGKNPLRTRDDFKRAGNVIELANRGIEMIRICYPYPC